MLINENSFGEYGIILRDFLLTLETLFRGGDLGIVRIRRDVRLVFYRCVDLKTNKNFH